MKTESALRELLPISDGRDVIIDRFHRALPMLPGQSVSEAVVITDWTIRVGSEIAVGDTLEAAMQRIKRHLTKRPSLAAVA